MTSPPAAPEPLMPLLIAAKPGSKPREVHVDEATGERLMRDLVVALAGIRAAKAAVLAMTAIPAAAFEATEYCDARYDDDGPRCELDGEHGGTHMFEAPDGTEVEWGDADGPGTCQACGTGTAVDDGLCAACALAIDSMLDDDEALPDCAGCGHPEADHRNEQGGPVAKGPCTWCRGCDAYALPQDEDPFEVPRALITLDCGCSFTGPVTSVKKVYCDTHGRHEPIASVTPYPGNGLQGPAPVVRVLDAPETAAAR
jgi:hypothetical protein